MTEAATTTSVSMQEFTNLCNETWEMYRKVAEESERIKVLSEKLNEMKSKVLAYMEHYELEKQHIPGYGTLSITNRFSVRVPKGDDKLKFFEFLKEKGVFEDMVTVNSQTLNSWYKEQLEEQLNAGNPDWMAPGIGEAKLSKTLAFRKG